MKDEKKVAFSSYKLSQLIEYRENLEKAKKALETLEKIYPELIKGACVRYNTTNMRGCVESYMNAIEDVRDLSQFIENETIEF